MLADIKSFVQDHPERARTSFNVSHSHTHWRRECSLQMQIKHTEEFAFPLGFSNEDLRTCMTSSFQNDVCLRRESIRRSHEFWSRNRKKIWVWGLDLLRISHLAFLVLKSARMRMLTIQVDVIRHYPSIISFELHNLLRWSQQGLWATSQISVLPQTWNSLGLGTACYFHCVIWIQSVATT